jgi:hypothetical protein
MVSKLCLIREVQNFTINDTNNNKKLDLIEIIEKWEHSKSKSDTLYPIYLPWDQVPYVPVEVNQEFRRIHGF